MCEHYYYMIYRSLHFKTTLSANTLSCIADGIKTEATETTESAVAD